MELPTGAPTHRPQPAWDVRSALVALAVVSLAIAGVIIILLVGR